MVQPALDFRSQSSGQHQLPSTYVDQELFIVHGVPRSIIHYLQLGFEFISWLSFAPGGVGCSQPAKMLYRFTLYVLTALVKSVVSIYQSQTYMALY